MAKIKTNPAKRKRIYIREWRKFRGLTLEQVAEKIDQTIGNVSAMERGNSNFTRAQLEAIAEVLQCDLGEMLSLNPNDEQAPWGIWNRLNPQQRKLALRQLQAFLEPT